jgi:hypothetical protein
MKKTLLLALALTLGACNSAYIVAHQDPASVPDKAQAVLPVADETAEAQQMLPLLSQKLSVNGFTVAPDLNSATWVMKLTVLEQEPLSSITLSLITADNYRAGNMATVWTAVAKSDSRIDAQSTFGKIIFPALLMYYGQSYQGPQYLNPTPK